MFFDYKNVFSKLKLQTINRVRPLSFKYLVELKENPSEIDKKKLQEYLKYFETVAVTMPSQEDAHSLLGVCHYYLENYGEAVSAFTKAVFLKPDLFLLMGN